jgi:predicted GH43/DUF377 family glycosyl hydrolase
MKETHPDMPSATANAAELTLTRVGDGPILTPRKHIAWEKDAVLNTAAIHDGKLFHLFYRGITHTPRRNMSCIGHAWSEDGLHFERADEPVLRNGTSPDRTQGVEDPRIVRIGDTYYLCYVTWNEVHANVGLATSKDLWTWEDRGIVFSYEQFGHNKNATLWPEKIEGRYALIHRPMGFGWGDMAHPLDMWLSMSPDLNEWSGHRRLLRARRGEVDWEYEKIGLGAPPFRTDRGWLMVYHAVDKRYVYRLGLVLLGLDDPTKVIKRTSAPILEPEAPWERAGDVSNVVFTCGAVLLGTDLRVYYGGADTVIGLARADVSSFLSEA